MAHIIENQMHLLTETSHAWSIKLELEQTKRNVEPEQNRVGWVCRQLNFNTEKPVNMVHLEMIFVLTWAFCVPIANSKKSE